MSDIRDFINLYIQDEMVDDALNDVSLKLVENIQDELYPGHGVDSHDLHDSIKSNIPFKNNLSAIIEAYTGIEYAPYVNDGTDAVKGKLMKMPWGYRMSRKAFKGYHFMEKGLEATVALYR